MVEDMKLNAPKAYRTQRDWDARVSEAISRAIRNNERTGRTYGIDKSLRVTVYNPKLDSTYLEIVGIISRERQWMDR